MKKAPTDLMLLGLFFMYDLVVAKTNY